MYKVSKQIYLDPFTKCYKNIVVIAIADNNDQELKKHLKTMPRSVLSPFKTFDCCRDESHCVHAFIDQDTRDFVLVDKIEKVIKQIDHYYFMRLKDLQHKLK